MDLQAKIEAAAELPYKVRTHKVPMTSSERADVMRYLAVEQQQRKVGKPLPDGDAKPEGMKMMRLGDVLQRVYPHEVAGRLAAGWVLGYRPRRKAQAASDA